MQFWLAEDDILFGLDAVALRVDPGLTRTEKYRDGSDLHCLDGGFCYARDPIRSRVRTFEEQLNRGDPMSAENAVLLIICVALCAYLLYALLKPEKF
jgi:K+-transporting ATPase KdpF subunit